MKICSMLGCFLAVFGICSADGASVYDDAVFWFRGGRELGTPDGLLQTGEFFDDLHADDLEHANHQVPFSGETEAMVLRTEKVVSPVCQAETNETSVLHLAPVTITTAEGGTKTYNPVTATPYALLKNCGLVGTNRYTFVLRVRRDPSIGLRLKGSAAQQRLLMVGYTAKTGFMMAFDAGGQILINRSVNGSPSAAQTSIVCPTNTWFDMAISVRDKRIRCAVAFPDGTAAGGGDTKLIRFVNVNSDADECMILPTATGTGSGTYLLFNSSTGQSDSCFNGSLAQLAIWNRDLDDDEILSAFGHPRPSLWRVGVDNGTTAEFGGARTGSATTVNVANRWLDVPAAISSADAWTFKFDVASWEKDLGQVFSLATTPDSASGTFSLSLNGKSCGEESVVPGEKARWFVRKGLVSGANEFVLTRTDSGANAVKPDSFALGGSFQVGLADNKNGELMTTTRIFAERISSATVSDRAWTKGVTTYDISSNLTIRVWVDPYCAVYCPAKFGFRGNLALANGQQTVWPEKSPLTIRLNGQVIGFWEDTTKQTWCDYFVDMEIGQLIPGWNEFKVEVPPRKSPSLVYFAVDYWRFSLLPWKKGMMLIFR